jgi:hypothetical protein
VHRHQLRDSLTGLATLLPDRLAFQTPQLGANRDNLRRHGGLGLTSERQVMSIGANRPLVIARERGEPRLFAQLRGEVRT